MSFDISRIGQDLGFGGFVLSNGEEFFIVALPEEVDSLREYLAKFTSINGVAKHIILDTRNGILEKIFFQTDVVETSVIDPDNHNQRIIVRKSQRQMDSKVQWDCFRRDNYTCRYCGKNDVPLTVDHVMTWESGGPTTVENLISACKKCNKTRGNLDYNDWLRSDYYQKVCVGLSPDQRTANADMQYDLNSGKIKPMFSKRKR